MIRLKHVKLGRIQHLFIGDEATSLKFSPLEPTKSYAYGIARFRFQFARVFLLISLLLLTLYTIPSIIAMTKSH